MSIEIIDLNIYPKKNSRLLKRLLVQVNSIDLFSNQMLEFLTHFVENMP